MYDDDVRPSRRARYYDPESQSGGSYSMGEGGGRDPFGSAHGIPPPPPHPMSFSQYPLGQHGGRGRLAPSAGAIGGVPLLHDPSIPPLAGARRPGGGGSLDPTTHNTPHACLCSHRTARRCRVCTGGR